jgi:cation diffusion facilitator family transporter
VTGVQTCALPILILAIVAALIGWESARRLASPVSINFRQATWVAALGLVVNLASAWLLQDAPAPGHTHPHDEAQEEPHDHDHGDDDPHDHDHLHDTPPTAAQPHHADHNLRAAYVHVLTDAITSVLAILGLLAGAQFGWIWMDAVMAIIGALVIARWSVGLMRDAGAVLLDAAADPLLVRRLRAALERFAALAAIASGEVGDGRPMTAVADALAGHQIDEVIVSTLPLGLSQWLRQDLPHRVARTYGLPVTHLVAAGEPARLAPS